jgi:hypothetical protein
MRRAKASFTQKPIVQIPLKAVYHAHNNLTSAFSVFIYLLFICEQCPITQTRMITAATTAALVVIAMRYLGILLQGYTRRRCKRGRSLRRY